MASRSTCNGGRSLSIFSSKLESILLDFESIGLQRAPHQVGHVGFAEVVFLLAGLDPREIEDIVDQRGQSLAFLANDLVVLVLFRRSGKPSQLQGLGIKADQRQRRPQFVRDVGHEVRFQLRQREFPGHVAIGEPHASGHQQRERAQNQEVGPEKFVAHLSIVVPRNLDPQDQSGENALKAPLHFRDSAIPADGGSHRTILFGGAHHDRRLRMRCVVGVLIRQHGVKCLRKEFVLPSSPNRKRIRPVPDVRVWNRAARRDTSD